MAERDRPAPPVIRLTLDRDTVCSQDPACSPDTVLATVVAQDPDGIDSVWLTFDGKTVGEDGFLEPSFQMQSRLAVRTGLAPGLPLPVAVRARDVAAFTHTVEDTVRVVR